VKGCLKSGKFWGGVLAGAVLVSFVPQLNPRTVLTGASRKV